MNSPYFLPIGYHTGQFWRRIEQQREMQRDIYCEGPWQAEDLHNIDAPDFIPAGSTINYGGAILQNGNTREF